MINDINKNYASVINLSSVSVSEAFASAASSKPIKINIVNLTPRGRVEIPVKIISFPAPITPVDNLENILENGTCKNSEFALMLQIYNILVDNNF